jgi:16S rRNA (uracil1498-N3)-methyltransferase
MSFFYNPGILIAGSFLTFSDEESHHAIKVLRLSPGSPVSVLNGKGIRAEGEISSIKAGKVEVLLDKISGNQPAPPLASLAIALLKKRDRLEWFIEKAVEIGVDQLILFSSEHSEKKSTELSRINKIAISALKQSGNLWLPEITTGISFKDFIRKPYHGQKFIAHCDNGEKILLKSACKENENCLVLIGPEGDFSKKEIASALENDFVPVSLGSTRLRSETAALTALLTIHILNEK